MELKDIFLTPIYLTIIYFVAFLIKERVVKDPQIKGYFIPGLTLKFIGGIAMGLIYQFHYRGGDTFGYFHASGQIMNAFSDSFFKGMELLLDRGGSFKDSTIQYTSNVPCYRSTQAFLVARISAIFGLFTFHTYAIISILFSFFSFIGVWAMFVTFYRIYPALRKEFAIICLFIPSLFFWGSGILKDSVTFGCLGLSFYCIFNIFSLKRNLFRNTILLLISMYLLMSIKIYILICFVPAFSIWIFMDYTERIKSNSLKAMVRPILFTFSILIGLGAAFFISEDDESYSMDNIITTSQVTGTYLIQASQGKVGSYYTLGDFAQTPMGMLSKAPQAIWVSLFRPYIWEAANAIMILSALESLFFFWLFIKTIYKGGIFKCISIIKGDSLVFSLLLFSLAFGFAIGISTFNFGTLVRYRIPLIPFFLAALAIIRYKVEVEKFIQRKKTFL